MRLVISSGKVWAQHVAGYVQRGYRIGRLSGTARNFDHWLWPPFVDGVLGDAAAWPSEETLRCDHTTLTISRIPYLDFRNLKWNTKSYALRDIERFRFAIYASAKGSSKYGFRFRANGRRHKTLPGLEAPEAQNILKALQGFGIDVVLDDKLQKKVSEVLERRGNQISLSL